MKMAKVFSVLCILLLAVSLVGCSSEKEDKLIEEGTYISQDEDLGANRPTVSLFEDGTYQVNLGVGQYFKGSFTVEEDVLTLTMDDNASKLDDEAIGELTFTINKEESQITSDNEIPDYVMAGTIFKL